MKKPYISFESSKNTNAHRSAIEAAKDNIPEKAYNLTYNHIIPMVEKVQEGFKQQEHSQKNNDISLDNILVIGSIRNDNTDSEDTGTTAIATACGRAMDGMHSVCSAMQGNSGLERIMIGGVGAFLFEAFNFDLMVELEHHKEGIAVKPQHFEMDGLKLTEEKLRETLKRAYSLGAVALGLQAMIGAKVGDTKSKSLSEMQEKAAIDGLIENLKSNKKD